MLTASGAAVALLVTTALHAGFQLTVSCVVYPALATLPPALWGAAHERHSRRITPLVAVVYVPLLTAVAAALLLDPSAATLVAAVGTALALGLTAGLAAPLHRRLGAAHDPVLVGRLLVADRWRSGCAVSALAAAVVDVLG